jgi:predicted Ser/Thr protein kinase
MTLNYEAYVLKRLQGHPSIPAVYAHRRFFHFEYLPMELLFGPNLGGIEKSGKLTIEHVLEIAN